MTFETFLLVFFPPSLLYILQLRFCSAPCIQGNEFVDIFAQSVGEGAVRRLLGNPVPAGQGCWFGVGRMSTAATRVSFVLIEEKHQRLSA